MVRLALAPALSGMIVIAGTLAFAMGPLPLAGSESRAAGMQQGQFELAIDADIENGDGPCNPIDDKADVEEGAAHRVGVCVLDPPSPVYSFLVRVVYDERVNRAPEVPDVLPALDDNPDANAGETTFSSPSLGERWDCSGMGIHPPSGDDSRTQDKHDAVLACHADLENPDTTLVKDGPLAVITVEAIDRGDGYIEFDPTTEIGDEFGTIGTCGLVPAQKIPCRGAVLRNPGGGPAASGSPEAAPEESPEALARAATPATTPATSPEMPTAAAAQSGVKADENGGFPWAVLGGALGGAALVVALLAGIYARRRSSRSDA